VNHAIKQKDRPFAGKRGKNVGAAAFFSCSGSTRYDS
jgi:hypothetical protein